MSAAGEKPGPPGPPREPVPVDFDVVDGVSETDALTDRVSGPMLLRVSNVLVKMFALIAESVPKIKKLTTDLTKGLKGLDLTDADIRCRVICFLAGTEWCGLCELAWLSLCSTSSASSTGVSCDTGVHVWFTLYPYRVIFLMCV